MTCSVPLPLSQCLNQQRPDSTLIAWDEKRHWTLAALRADVLALVRQLAVYRQKRWALCVEDSYLFIVGLLGLLHSARTPVIAGHSRPAQLAGQRQWFDGILTDKAFPFSCPLLELRSATGYPGSQTAASVVLPAVPAESHVELFTSGSTGQPRRVVKPLSCLDAETRLLAAHFASRLAGCRIIASVVAQHQYGLTFRLLLPLALGIPLQASRLYYPEQLTALDPAYRYLLVSSPAFLKRLDYRLPPPPLCLILSAGGELPWQQARQIHHWLGISVDEIYGSSETGVLGWRYRQQERQPWQAFPGLRFQPQPQGLRVTSPLIPQPDGLLLDDVLVFDAQGGFQLHGRRDRVVKIEEKRISLIEVEQRLLALDGVSDAAALLIHRAGRQVVAALLVLSDEARRALQGSDGRQQPLRWRRELLRWLEPVAIPRYWRVVSAIPVNSLDKRIDAQLRELFDET